MGGMWWNSLRAAFKTYPAKPGSAANDTPRRREESRRPRLFLLDALTPSNRAPSLLNFVVLSLIAPASYPRACQLQRLL
jgi:hypothetical protein